MPEKRPQLLLFDNGLVGVCNMGCLYCRERSFEVVAQDLVSNNGTRVDLNSLGNKLLAFTQLARDHFDIPILKISGYGEFFILPNALQIIRILSKDYERIQIITNATQLVERTIAQLSEIPGINICVSIDGHTPELNYCRTTDYDQITKIFNNIDLLRKYDIPVEINSVLTKYNIPKFSEFIEYLAKRYDRLTCYPFPARGTDSMGALGPKNAERLLPLGDTKQKNAHILPHQAYIKRLLSFIRNGKRSEKCLVGFSNLGLDPSGNILLCACNLKKAIGNIFLEEPVMALNRRPIHPWFDHFFFRQSLFEGCLKCFTHYEIINLYLDGTITLKEISRSPLFSGPRSQKRLKELKERLDRELLNSEGTMKKTSGRMSGAGCEVLQNSGR